MPITITTDKADELPEQLRPLAKEEGGKFMLAQIPDGWGIDNIAQGRARLTKLEQDLKRRDERLKTFAVDGEGKIPEPDEFKALLAEHKQLKEAQGKQPNIDELRKSIHAESERNWSGKLTAAEKRAQDLDRLLDNTLLDAEINQLVAQLRPRDGKADVVRLLLRNDLALDKSDDGKRQIRVRGSDGKDWMLGNGPDGYMPAKDYALNILRAKHADMFEGDGVSGAGVAGGGQAGRRSKYSIKRSEIESNPIAYTKMVAKAKSEGATVDIVD